MVPMGLLTTLLCNLTSGQSQPWRTFSRRMGLTVGTPFVQWGAGSRHVLRAFLLLPILPEHVEIEFERLSREIEGQGDRHLESSWVGGEERSTILGNRDSGWRGHRLRREWPVYDPIGDVYLEMIVAPDALNHLVAHLCESSTGGDMNPLLGLTMLAFHRHNDIGLVGHWWYSVRRISPENPSAPRSQ